MSASFSPKELEKKGKSAYQRGDFLLAAETYQAARRAYKAAGDELQAAEMANNCSVAYLQAEEPQEALKAVDGTAEIFARSQDLRRQGMAMGNYAAALEALGRVDEAVEAYLESAKLLEQAGEDRLRAEAMQSLSALQFKEGRQLEALASMQSGLDGVKRPSPKQRFLKRLLNIPFEMLNRNKSTS
jgi:tetratricopeptide (TPR) repeat protein